MNIKLERFIFLFIIGFTMLSIVGLFQLLQSIGIMLGFTTQIIFLPLNWVMFIAMGYLFYKIAKGKVI